MKKIAITVLLSAGFLFAARGETVRLFDASAIPVDYWVWSDARIAPMDGAYRVSEINKRGDYGCVFVENYLPYHPAAVLELDVDRVVSGDYTLQVLSFTGKSHTDTQIPVKSSVKTGKTVIRMGDLKIPADCQAVIIKFWVGGAEGASTIVKSMTYSLDLGATDVVLDENFADLSSWQLDGLVVEPGDGAGVALAEGKGYGSMLLNPVLDYSEDAFVLVHAPSVSSSTLTLQIAAMGEDREFLAAYDAVKDFGSGWRGVQLGRVNTGGSTMAAYRIKLWMAGNPDAAARIARVLVLKQGQDAE